MLPHTVSMLLLYFLYASTALSEYDAYSFIDCPQHLLFFEFGMCTKLPYRYECTGRFFF